LFGLVTEGIAAVRMVVVVPTLMDSLFWARAMVLVVVTFVVIVAITEVDSMLSAPAMALVVAIVDKNVVEMLALPLVM